MIIKFFNVATSQLLAANVLQKTAFVAFKIALTTDVYNTTLKMVVLVEFILMMYP